MGGKATLLKNTHKVLIECAHFNPEAIIGKQLNMDLTLRQPISLREA